MRDGVEEKEGKEELERCRKRGRRKRKLVSVDRNMTKKKSKCEFLERMRKKALYEWLEILRKKNPSASCLQHCAQKILVRVACSIAAKKILVRVACNIAAKKT